MLLGAHPVILVGNQMWQIFAEEFKFWILTVLRMKLSSSQCSYNSHTSMALRIHVSQKEDAAISWDFLFVSTLCTLYMYLFRSQHVGPTRCWPLNDASSLILWWIFLAICASKMYVLVRRITCGSLIELMVISWFFFLPLDAATVALPIEWTPFNRSFLKWK